MDDSFVNLGDEVILTLLWQSAASESVTVCVCVCVCALTCGREEDMSHNHGLCANTITQLCSPLGLKLMVKLRTLITVFILALKAEARDYGKGRYISGVLLWCSANHNALGQLANQSRLCLSEGGTF